jgi:hypothetical protein
MIRDTVAERNIYDQYDTKEPLEQLDTFHCLGIVKKKLAIGANENPSG